MQYRIDDLLVSIVPGVFRDLGTITEGCTGDTCGGGGSGCSPPCTDCSQCGTDSQDFDFSDVVYPPYLENLKARLRMVLAAVERRERELDQNRAPRTAEEIQLLEQKLMEALDALRARRADLPGR